MIEVKDIHKSYSELEVLKGVNFKAKKGEVVSIVGSSGAGKTTFLQIIGTLLDPDRGSVIIDNTDILKLRSKQLSAFRNQKIGFVFQFHQLLPEFTAFENICIPGYIAKKDQIEVEKRAHELLEFLKIEQRASHKPSELSGGEQQRVAVARSLINSPSIIMADEPSGNLDSQNKLELHKLFFSLRDQFGHTFIIVTHDNDLADMADRKLEMADGRFV